MAWSKQGAVGMLMAVFLWTAAPLLASLPAQAKTDCCAAMMQDYGAMMSSTCCRLAPTHTPATTVHAYAPEHERHAAIVHRGQFLPLLTDAAITRQTLLAMHPPDPSPGGLSVLRI